MRKTYFIYINFLVNLCSNPLDKLEIYRENFEAAYIKETEDFYKIKAPEQLQLHGVEKYMKYAEIKLMEEELRAQKYLEPNSASVQLLMERCVNVLVANFKTAILGECQRMIQEHQTESKFMHKLKINFNFISRSSFIIFQL